MTRARKFVAGNHNSPEQEYSEARAELSTDLSNVRHCLLHPSARVLEDALPELQRVVERLDTCCQRLRLSGQWLRRGSAPLLAPASDTESSEAWKVSRQVHRELVRELVNVRALAQQAASFYSERLRLLTGQDFSVVYDARGTAQSETGADRSANCAVPIGQVERTVVLHG